MSGKYTQDELAALTEEEREGLAELEAEEAEDAGGDADEGDAAEGEETAGDGGDAADPEAGEGDSVEKAAPEADAEAQHRQEEAATTEPEAEARAAEPAPPQPVRDYGYPENYDQRVADIDAKRDDLAQKLDDGDISGREFNAQSRELDRQAQDLREQRLRAELARDRDLDAWQANVGRFLAEHPQYEAGSFLYNVLDGEVTRLQKSVGGSLDPALLQQAHANILAQMRGAAPAAEPAKPAAKPVVPPAPAAKAAAKPKPAIPPTLAHVPAAATEETGETSAYAYLDRLAGTDHARYLAELQKLTPEQLERYENGA